MCPDIAVELGRGCTREREPVRQVMRPYFIYQAERLIAAAAFGFRGRLEQFIGCSTHRGDNHDWPATLVTLHDAGNARDRFLRFDGGAAELHDDHRSYLSHNP